MTCSAWLVVPVRTKQLKIKDISCYIDCQRDLQNLRVVNRFEMRPILIKKTKKTKRNLDDQSTLQQWPVELQNLAELRIHCIPFRELRSPIIKNVLGLILNCIQW